MSERFNLENLRDILSKNHYKVTPQRKEIVRIFVEKADTQHHLSAEEVYDILLNKGFDFGLATVYRSVELLSTLGILSRIDFGDGRARYELATGNPNQHNHHHLICLNCKKVIEFEEDLLDKLERTIEKKSKFKIENHEVKFFGYCSDCQKKLERRK